MQRVDLPLGILAGGVGLLGLFLVFSDISPMIGDHVRRELAIELHASHLRHFVEVSGQGLSEVGLSSNGPR